MAGVPKTDALETFLTGISQSRGDTGRDDMGGSPDDDAALPGNVVILTILNKEPDPTPRDVLMRRSELTPGQFERTLEYLLRIGWVEIQNGGFRLTNAGREAAEQERKRLLRFR
jgi:hypothetical protein